MRRGGGERREEAHIEYMLKVVDWKVRYVPAASFYVR
jgi:hypothetical protein